MKLTQKGQLAIKCMIALAVKEKLSIKEIALQYDYPKRYLEQIFSALKNSHLVSSSKGPSGGYSLNKGLDEISLKDIIEAVEGLHPFETKDQMLLDQVMNKHLNQVDHLIDHYLCKTKLKDLVDDYQTFSNYNMYYI